MPEFSTSSLTVRREALQKTLGRGPMPPLAEAGPLTPEGRDHLVEEGVELFWNDLEWEALTGEEALEGGPLVELTFPGFLAFAKGLVLTEVMPDSLDRARPRPQVVEDLLQFLEERREEFGQDMAAGTDDEQVERARVALPLVSGLMDRLLFLLFQVTPDERARLEPEIQGG
ncbi:MAG: hypothetical protein WEA09_12000 [Gemmatimonadota bacterium]